MKRQNGNALFLILIAVALFAALSYAITSSGRGGGSIDKEQATIDAARVLETLANVNQAALRLRVIGQIPDHLIDLRSDLRLRDTGAIYTTYGPNAACTNTGCRLYHEDGGDILYPTFENLALPNNSDWPSDFMPGHGLAVVAKVDQVGSDLPEIMESYYGIKEDVCLAINRQAGLPDEPQHSFASETLYAYRNTVDIVAALSSSDSYIFGDDFDDLDGATTFCTVWTTSPKRWFLWHVIVAR